MTVRVLIVDDERLARLELRRLLAAHPHLEVVGEADSVEQASEAIRALDPELIFLDIQMPRRSGFELLEVAPVQGRVVFVTAHDVHAIRAFEVNAFDYLLKPVHPQRLALTIDRLNQRQEPSAKPLVRLKIDDHLFLTEARSARFIRVRAIVCLRGADDYAELLFDDGQRMLSSSPLKHWEARLPEESFVRVHRSAIVNLEHVQRVEAKGDDTFSIYLKGDETPVPLSRRHASRLRHRG